MDGASSGRVEIGFSGIIGSTIAKISCNQNFNYPFYIYEPTLKSQINGNQVIM